MTESRMSIKDTALNHIKSVSSKDAPNYLVSSTAAALALANLTLNEFEGTSCSFYLNALNVVFFSAVAANQYGFEDSFKAVTAVGQKASTYASAAATSVYNYGMSLFASQPEATPVQEEALEEMKKETEKPATRSSKK